MYYIECPYCGSNLDPGEKCDCRDNKEEKTEEMKKLYFSDSNGQMTIREAIDDNEYEMQTPVLNGANPVKDNSMNQQRVWNSMCRAFVKCVAIHTGLGFDLWLKEEYDKTVVNIPETGEKPASEAKIKTIKNICVSHGIDADAWVMGNGKTWETLTEIESAKMLKALKDRYGDD